MIDTGIIAAGRHGLNQSSLQLLEDLRSDARAHGWVAFEIEQIWFGVSPGHNCEAVRARALQIIKEVSAQTPIEGRELLRLCASMSSTSRRGSGRRRETENALARSEGFWGRTGGLAYATYSPPAWILRRLSKEWRVDWANMTQALDDPAEFQARRLLIGPQTFDADRTERGRFGDDAAHDVRPAGQMLPQEAAASLVRAVDEAVDAALSGAERPMIEVSGGLDSAIVAASAARRIIHGRALWVHHIGPDRESDELRYAKDLAEHLGVTLKLRRRAAPAPGCAVIAHPLELRPSINRLDQAFDEAEARFYRSEGIDAVLTGKGGDAVFMQGAIDAALVDQWIAEGASALAWSRLLAYGAWSKRSAYAVLVSALRTRLRGLGPAPSNPYVNREQKPQLFTGSIHDRPAPPPAKQHQLMAIASSLALRGSCARSRAATVHHPLLSDTVIRSATSLPAYVLTAPGRDRALARQAFADRLPNSILERRSKAELSGYFGKLILHSLPELRTHLFEGVLAQQGMIDRPRLEADLSPEALVWGVDYLHILLLALVESWLKAWSPYLPRG